MTEFAKRLAQPVKRSAKDIANERWARQTRQAVEEQAERDTVAEKTARLRELRLAKEAAEKSAAAEAALAKPKRQKRRAKQTEATS